VVLVKRAAAGTALQALPGATSDYKTFGETLGYGDFPRGPKFGPLRKRQLVKALWAKRARPKPFSSTWRRVVTPDVTTHAELRSRHPNE